MSNEYQPKTINELLARDGSVNCLGCGKNVRPVVRQGGIFGRCPICGGKSFGRARKFKAAQIISSVTAKDRFDRWMAKHYGEGKL